MISSTIWTVGDPLRLTWREWDDGTLVYDCRSNETHQLNELSATALRCLLEKPGTVGELYERLRAIFDVEDLHAFYTQLDHLVRQFDDIGLIEPYIK